MEQIGNIQKGQDLLLKTGSCLLILNWYHVKIGLSCCNLVFLNVEK